MVHLTIHGTFDYTWYIWLYMVHFTCLEAGLFGISYPFNTSLSIDTIPRQIKEYLI